MGTFRRRDVEEMVRLSGRTARSAPAVGACQCAGQQPLTTTVRLASRQSSHRGRRDNEECCGEAAHQTMHPTVTPKRVPAGRWVGEAAMQMRAARAVVCAGNMCSRCLPQTPPEVHNCESQHDIESASTCMRSTMSQPMYLALLRVGRRALLASPSHCCTATCF